MSLPLNKEVPKSLLVTIRIIKLILPLNFPKNIPSIVIKFGKNTWHSSKPLEDSHKITWKLSHTFEIPEIIPMYIGVFYKSGLFSESEYSSCVVKSENFSSKKGIKYTELLNENEKATIFWTYIIEEDRKFENNEMLKLLNEVEVEREEVRYYKYNIQIKLLKLKKKSITCKEELKHFMRHFESILESCNGDYLENIDFEKEIPKIQMQSPNHVSHSNAI